MVLMKIKQLICFNINNYRKAGGFHLTENFVSSHKDTTSIDVDGSKSQAKQENRLHTSINIPKMHLGLPGMGELKVTRDFLDYKITGALYKCEDCTMTKRGVKNSKEIAENKMNPGNRIDIYIIYHNSESYCCSYHWILMVDYLYLTSTKCSFLVRKIELGRNCGTISIEA